MPARYAQGALKFAYPNDWELAEEETADWPRSVAFQIPGGGYWSVYHYPPESDRLALMEEVLETLKQEYDEVEIMERDELRSAAFIDGYDLSFFCLDFLVECSIRSWEGPAGSLIWIYQAESQDFDIRAESFNLVADSLLEHFAKA